MHSPVHPLRDLLYGALVLGLATLLALLFALPSPAVSVARPPEDSGLPDDRVAELRARGPAALDELLARHRAALTTASPPVSLEYTVDAVAGQRYAAYSGLYWYTDLDLAKRAARDLQRPILALRMLGDLREDLSCANSRLFRTALYANTELAAFLRSNFVLYWSSERPVPRVTIEFGNGRTLVRTLTGNSAHYVLDADGHVLDVLPGLYAAVVFRRELEASLALARRLRGKPDRERIDATAAYHLAAATATDLAWERSGVAGSIYGRFYMLGGGLASAIARAQAAAVTKANLEVPALTQIGLITPNEFPREQAAWSAVARKVWNIEDGAPLSTVLDDNSRALIARLYRAGPADPRATDAVLTQVVARLEYHILADTALNQFTLRQIIHRKIAGDRQTDFTALDAWIYDEVFATPRSDPWLGLHPRTDFTGLPGDGNETR